MVEKMGGSDGDDPRWHFAALLLATSALSLALNRLTIFYIVSCLLKRIIWQEHTLPHDKTTQQKWPAYKIFIIVSLFAHMTYYYPHSFI